MILDFKVQEWYIRSFTDNWGPFRFPLSSLLPSGAVISAATVKTFKKSGGTESTTQLVESGSTTIASNTNVDVNWQHPGTSVWDGDHYVKIEVTLTNDSEKHVFLFGYLVVE